MHPMIASPPERIGEVHSSVPTFTVNGCWKFDPVIVIRNPPSVWQSIVALPTSLLQPETEEIPGSNR